MAAAVRKIFRAMAATLMAAMATKTRNAKAAEEVVAVADTGIITITGIIGATAVTAVAAVVAAVVTSRAATTKTSSAKAAVAAAVVVSRISVLKALSLGRMDSRSSTRDIWRSRKRDLGFCVRRRVTLLRSRRMSSLRPIPSSALACGRAA